VRPLVAYNPWTDVVTKGRFLERVEVAFQLSTPSWPTRKNRWARTHRTTSSAVRADRALLDRFAGRKPPVISLGHFGGDQTKNQ